MDLKNGHRETPLWLALHHKQRRGTGRVLVALGAQVGVVGGVSGVPLLSSLCEGGRLDAIQLCREEWGAPVDQLDDKGASPLHAAALFCRWGGGVVA